MQLSYIALITFPGNVLSLGINCEGSAECPFCRPQTSLRELQTECNYLDDNTYYQNGQQACCTYCYQDNAQQYQVCAFLQNTSNGAPGHSIKSAIQSLIDHGCGLCGSAPFYNNDVSEGELTVNIVDHTSCTGITCG